MSSSAMLPVKMRVAKPSNSLKNIERFYVRGLGLDLLGSFKDHDGYDGILIGKDGFGYELEFTHAHGASYQLSQDHDFLLVFYIQSTLEVQVITARMMRLGYREVEPLNPYWKGISNTYEDPDGWRVVVFDMQAREGRNK